MVGDSDRLPQIVFVGNKLMHVSNRPNFGNIENCLLVVSVTNRHLSIRIVIIIRPQGHLCALYKLLSVVSRCRSDLFDKNYVFEIALKFWSTLYM